MSSVTPSTLRSLALGCVEPRDLDILVGKSTECRQHRGSRCFAVFVESYRQRYQLTKNKHKRGAITLEMYQILSEQNLRFLRFDEALLGWKEVSPKEARDKITHALKYAQKKHTKTKKPNARQLPGRNGSASSHRSETSHATASSLASNLSSSHRSLSSRGSAISSSQRSTAAPSVSSQTRSSGVASVSRRRSLDWDQLLKQQQQSLRNSLLSVGEETNNNNNNHEPTTSIFQRGQQLSQTKTPSMSSQATRTTQCTSTTDTHATVASSTIEAEPIPFDVSTTQYVDMFFPSVNREAMDDRLPKIPARPPINDDYDEDFGEGGDIIDHSVVEEILDNFCPTLFDHDLAHHEQQQQQQQHGVTPTTTLSSECKAISLDPLLESPGGCSSEEGSHTSDTPPQSNVGGGDYSSNKSYGEGAELTDDHDSPFTSHSHCQHHVYYHHHHETIHNDNAAETEDGVADIDFGTPSRQPSNNEDAMPKIPSRHVAAPNDEDDDYDYNQADNVVVHHGATEEEIMEEFCPLFDELTLQHDVVLATERNNKGIGVEDPPLEQSRCSSSSDHTSDTPPRSNVSGGMDIQPSIMANDNYDDDPPSANHHRPPETLNNCRETEDVEPMDINHNHHDDDDNNNNNNNHDEAPMHRSTMHPANKAQVVQDLDAFVGMMSELAAATSIAESSMMDDNG